MPDAPLLRRADAVFTFTDAIVRAPARSVVSGLSAGAERPTYDGVAAEHAAYIGALEAAGVRVAVLPALEAFPDSVFVEDPALVFPDGAVLLRSGAPSRRSEAAAIAPALRERFDVVLGPPEKGFADGGDVLTTPEVVLIGVSARTDKAGAEALAGDLVRLGRKARIVATPKGVLHFKSDCALLDEDKVLATRRLAGSGVFAGFETVLVPDGEEGAANALRINDVVFVGADYPRTADLLDARGYKVVALRTAEIAKIDAGLSCLSLRWRASSRSAAA